jgi:hypothetical protein
MSKTKTFARAGDASFTLMVDPLHVAPPGPLDIRLGDSVRPSPSPTPTRSSTPKTH